MSQGEEARELEAPTPVGAEDRVERVCGVQETHVGRELVFGLPRHLIAQARPQPQAGQGDRLDLHEGRQHISVQREVRRDQGEAEEVDQAIARAALERRLRARDERDAV